MRGKDGPDETGAMRPDLHRRLAFTAPPPVPGDADRTDLQRAMTEGAGVLRSAESLDRTASFLATVPTDDPEVRNLVTVGAALLTAALAREESRGSHTRTDFPDTRDELRTRMVLI